MRDAVMRLLVLLLCWLACAPAGCKIDRVPQAASDGRDGRNDDGAGQSGDGSGGHGGGDGDGAPPGGDFWGGPCSDDDPSTPCATGVGDAGNDPACSDGNAATPCPDGPQDVGDGDGDSVGDGDPVGDGDGDTGQGACGRVCDDGFYCNGLERCEPVNPTADLDGCVTSGVCASGEVCLEGSQSCAPCGDGDDPDGDGYPDVRCGGADCREGDPNVNPGTAEACNGIDDDCDGVVDGDNAREACSTPLLFLSQHVLVPGCVAGACVVEACQPWWFDCNHDIADGCEHAMNPTPGDCVITDCAGNVVPEDNDTDNGDPCREVTCANGVPSEKITPGAMCGDSAFCNPVGQCVSD